MCGNNNNNNNNNTNVPVVIQPRILSASHINTLICLKCPLHVDNVYGKKRGTLVGHGDT